MQPTKLLEVRHVDMLSAAKFGLLYGFMWGIIMGFVYLILVSIFGSDIFPTTDRQWLDFITVIGSSVLAVFLLIVVGGSLYNLVYPLGGHLHLGMAEFEHEVEVAAEKEKAGETQADKTVARKADPWFYGFPKEGGTPIGGVKPKPAVQNAPVATKNKPKLKSKKVLNETQAQKSKTGKSAQKVTSGGMSIARNY